MYPNEQAASNLLMTPVIQVCCESPVKKVHSFHFQHQSRVSGCHKKSNKLCDLGTMKAMLSKLSKISKNVSLSLAAGATQAECC